MRYNLCVISILLFITGCHTTKINPSSKFIENFSIANIIKEMNVRELNQLSAPTGKTASAGNPSEHFMDFAILYDIKDSADKIFNEKIFLTELKNRVEMKTRELGIKSHATGASNDSFYIAYNNGAYVGIIDIIATRLEGNKYKLWCNVRELASGVK